MNRTEKLDKWTFSLGTDHEAYSSEQDIICWVAARLLSLIERTSLRKFVVTIDGDEASSREAVEVSSIHTSVFVVNKQK